MEKILLIGEKNRNREKVQAKLTASGYDVVVATDYRHGSTLTGCEKLNLILFDISSRSQVNWRTLRSLKKDPRLKRIPLFVTGDEMTDEILQKAVRLGVTGYIATPFQFSMSESDNPQNAEGEKIDAMSAYPCCR
jgi:putative two-component system response regulator